MSSSRIIIKNLPKNITEGQLRDHFASKGHITDVKLAKTPEGTFRRFAYIGFETEGEARTAVKYFHGTFVHTSKVVVEFAKPPRDPELPKPYSRHSGQSVTMMAIQDREREERLQKQQNKDKAKQEMLEKKRKLLTLYEAQNDPELQSYLSAMQPRSQGKTWSNDDAFVPSHASSLSSKSSLKSPSLFEANEKVHVKTEAVPSKKQGGKHVLKVKTHVTFGEKSAEPTASSTPNAPDDEEDDLYQDLRDLKQDTAALQETQPSSEPLFDAPKEPVESMVSSAQIEEAIQDTGRLFVRNLAYTCKEEELTRLFSPFGPISEVHIPLVAETKKPKGFAYVLFVLPDHALKAYKALEGSIFQGRLLRMLPARDKPAPVESEGSASGDAYKDKKLKELRKHAQSSGAQMSWQTLFVNNDAVMEYMAKKLGVRKGDLLNPDASDDMASRVALAETHVIQETKKYFAEENVHFDAMFEGGEKGSGPSHRLARSKTVILIKNIPFSTEEAELVSLFGAYGSIHRIVLPPTKALALIEFLESSEAKTAFSHLAYRKFKSAPLYLEFAPEGILEPAANRTSLNASMNVSTKEEPRPQSTAEAATATMMPMATRSAVLLEQILEDKSSDATNDPSKASCTLFIKNLNFNTKESDLKSRLKSLPGFVNCQISTRKDPKKPGQILSCGYGFVEFESQSTAESALASLQHFILDGHALLFRYSQASAGSKAARMDGPDPESQNATKIIVRNIAFEANAKDIRSLFQPFGQIKRVRLPKKMDGTHRGFGFVEFASKKDALSAFEAVRHSHLYGRHLVLEWANEDEQSHDLEKLREKTSQQLKSLYTIERSKKAKQALSKNTEEDETADHARQSNGGGGDQEDDDDDDDDEEEDD